MNEFLIKASQLFLSLAILVTLHELGHFIPAVLFKTRVEKFYLFFNPWFSLFRIKKVHGRWQTSWLSKASPSAWNEDPTTTEWGIGWLPLGGFVKIAGMIDESMDKEQMAKPKESWEFRSKKVWQRLIIMVGGVTVNLGLGLIIYGAIVWYWGGMNLNPKQLQEGMAIHPYLAKYDILSGDVITAVDGEEVHSFEDINKGVLLRNKTNLTIVRKGKELKRVLPEDIDQELFQNGAMGIANFRVLPQRVKEVVKTGNGKKAGLEAKDSILFIDNVSVKYFDEIQKALFNKRGKKATLRVLRGKDTLSLVSDVTIDGTIGFACENKGTSDTLALTPVRYNVAQSISKGFFGGGQLLKDYVSQFKFVFTKKGASSVGGFARIGDMFASDWDWKVFWMNTAFLSIALAFMNILPIPALDGGHVVFLIYEWITGKEAPQKILEYAQYVGIVLLLGLMVYANGNDLIQFVFK